MIFRAQEEEEASKSGTPTQDGGNSGNTREPTLSTREERSSMFMEDTIMKEETSLHGINITVLTSNGISFMLIFHLQR